MKERKLNYRIHDPNSPEVTAAYLLIWDQRHPLSHAAELVVKEVCDSLGISMPG